MSKAPSFLLYVGILVLLFAVATRHPLTGYIIYSHLLAYMIAAATYRRLPMGIKGVQEVWLGKKAVAVAVVLLTLLVIGGLSWPTFDGKSFAIGVPFGAAYGWWIYKLSSTADVPER